MHGCIEHLNDRITDRDCMGYERGVVHETCEPLRDVRLARAGIAVDEQCLAGIEGWSQSIEERGVEYGIGKGRMHPCPRYQAVAHRVVTYHLGVELERHWSRSHVAAPLEGNSGACPAALGEPVTQSVFIGRARAHFDAAFTAQEIQHFFEDRPGEGCAFDHRAQSQHTGLVYVLLEQLSEERQAEACLRERLGPRRRTTGANGN